MAVVEMIHLMGVLLPAGRSLLHHHPLHLGPVGGRAVVAVMAFVVGLVQKGKDSLGMVANFLSRKLRGMVLVVWGKVVEVFVVKGLCFAKRGGMLLRWMPVRAGSFGVVKTPWAF